MISSKKGAHCCQYAPCLFLLLRAENTVAGVAETGDDVAVIVQDRVHARRRKRRRPDDPSASSPTPARRADDAHELDVTCSRAAFRNVHGRRRAAAGGEASDPPRSTSRSADVGRQLAVILRPARASPGRGTGRCDRPCRTASLQPCRRPCRDRRGGWARWPASCRR